MSPAALVVHVYMHSMHFHFLLYTLTFSRFLHFSLYLSKYNPQKVIGNWYENEECYVFTKNCKMSHSSFVTILQNKIPADISMYTYTVPTKLHRVIRDKSDVETSKFQLVHIQHAVKCHIPHLS